VTARPACRHALVALVATVAVGVGVGIGVGVGVPGTVGAGASQRRSAVSDRPLPTAPLASALSMAAGTWVTLAMGRLQDPRNRFWQALVLPAGSTRWAVVTPPGVATNGGLVTTGASDPTTLVGFEPSQFLAFSPLATSSDAGRSWSQGTIDERLAPVPDSLALTPGGTGAALVGTTSRTILQSAGTDLSSWRPLATAPMVRSSPGSGPCGVGELTAVASVVPPPGPVLVGASCARGAHVGILEGSGTRWAMAGPTLPASLDVSGTSVLRLTAATGVLDALVEARPASGGAHILLAAQRAVAGGAWTVSGALRLGARATVIATGFGARGTTEVVTRTGSITDVASVRAGPGARWRVRTAPAGSAVVAVTPSGTDAMVPRGANLTVSALDPSSGTWTVAQRLHVPIEYGSSS